MQYRNLVGVIGLLVSMSSSAEASDLPLYQPAPAWVVVVPAPNTANVAADAPAMVIFDRQQRVEDGRLWSYVDSATRMVSPEMLSQFATLTVPWAPDKGDLIVHELAILRGDQRIDLLGQGQKFTVLRREEALERRELTGILTATLAIEGLRVGDVLRIRATTTEKDDALAGRVQSLAEIVAAPMRVGTARMRYSWPTAAAPRWKVLASGVTATPANNGAYTELSLTLPAPKQPEMPGDAPPRYRHPPIIEISSFADWADVSRVMAPLYATEDAIAPGSAIAAEVAAIMRAEPSPLGRAQRALQLVQDQIRYLAVGMDGGNYVPQSPARTWEVRYGDCKAKTLLLLALLHAMNVEAEPVLANTDLGDAVPDRLPSALAFNHILVRASIGGETLWLDGTGAGSRLADIHDTPPFRHVLPVRAEGAGLVEIITRANARPDLDLTINADESASADLPSVFDATAVVRGAPAAMLTLGTSQLGEKEKRDEVATFFQAFLGEAQLSSASIAPDLAAGTVILTARGVVTTPWITEERRRKRNLSFATRSMPFAPDRGRPSWSAIPVARPGPGGLRLRLRIRLPEGGRGYAMEGEPDLSVRFGGYQLTRTLRLADGIVTLDERLDATGSEIPAAQIAVERDKAATARSGAPRIIAPANARRRWDLAAGDPPGATQVKSIETVFGAAIAHDPDEVSGYVSRASFRGAIGDWRGAQADLTRALALAPTVDRYLQRGRVARELGDLTAAMADAEAARRLDPSSSPANQTLAQWKAESGDLTSAVALLDERIALGGDTRFEYRNAKANVIGEFGDPAEGLRLFDELAAEDPGSPLPLNGRCWIKGTRSVMIDTAVKDCTDAIERNTITPSALDSRALAWYRLAKYEEALRDLDAVLALAPGLAESRFMRGVVLTRLDRRAEAGQELRIARRLQPSVDQTYARFGIKP